MRQFIIFLFLGLTLNAFSQTKSDLQVYEFEVQFGEKTTTKHLMKEVKFSKSVMDKEIEYYVNGQKKAVSSFIYQKDSIIVKAQYNYNGKLEYKYSYKLGTDGLKKLICFYPDGSIYTTKNFFYENGLLKKVEMYYGNGNLYNTVIYQYFERDNYTEMIELNLENETVSTTHIYKDAAGNISKEIIFNRLGEMTKYLEYNYTKSTDVSHYFLLH